MIYWFAKTRRRSCQRVEGSMVPLRGRRFLLLGFLKKAVQKPNQIKQPLLNSAQAMRTLDLKSLKHIQSPFILLSSSNQKTTTLIWVVVNQWHHIVIISLIRCQAGACLTCRWFYNQINTRWSCFLTGVRFLSTPNALGFWPPDLQEPFISVSQLCDDGKAVCFTSDGCFIFDHATFNLSSLGKRARIGGKRGNLFYSPSTVGAFSIPVTSKIGANTNM